MNFFNDLKAEFNCAFNISTDFKVVMLNSVAYFENIVGVKSYSKENIELAIKKGNIKAAFHNKRKSFGFLLFYAEEAIK